MKTIKQTYQIKASVEKVWEALVNPKIIEKWSGAGAKMDAKVGTKFELWNGDIHGTNTEVVDPPAGGKKLVQDWYGGDWAEPSKATFILKENDGETEVSLVNENVPDDAADDIDDGWTRYYLGEIKKLLEK